MPQSGVSKLWLGCNFPLEVQNKRSEGTMAGSRAALMVRREEEEGGGGDGEYLEEGLASGVRR